MTPGYGSQGVWQATRERQETQSGVRAEPQGSLLTADVPRPFSRLPMQAPMGARPASDRQTERGQRPPQGSLDRLLGEPLFGRRTAPVEPTLSQRWEQQASSRPRREEVARAVPRPLAEREADALRWRQQLERGMAEENARREAVRRRAADSRRATRAAQEVDSWLQQRATEARWPAESAP